MEAGGNSGIFLWSDAIPKGRLPKGMEVQMLELQWPYINRKRNGEPNHLGYVSGELFGAGGMRAIPENPRGSRSMSYEMRCKGKGEWNRYVVVAVDGTVKLSINGTPTFIIGNTIIRGFISSEQLQEIIDNVRKKQ